MGGEEDASEVIDVYHPVPGLYGATNGIVVDVGRIPRMDQFNYSTIPVAAAGTDSSLLDMVAGVKTVAYFLNPPGTGGGSQAQGGLVRRELDQAVTSYAANEGGSDLSDLDQKLEPIAPEVADLHFQYWDGTEWDESWDTQQQNGLPLAVMITLSLYPPKGQPGAAPLQAATLGASNQNRLSTYTMTVYLPNQSTQGDSNFNTIAVYDPGTTSAAASSSDEEEAAAAAAQTGGSTAAGKGGTTSGKGTGGSKSTGTGKAGGTSTGTAGKGGGTSTGTGGRGGGTSTGTGGKGK